MAAMEIRTILVEKVMVANHLIGRSKLYSFTVPKKVTSTFGLRSVAIRVTRQPLAAAGVLLLTVFVLGVWQLHGWLRTHLRASTCFIGSKARRHCIGLEQTSWGVTRSAVCCGARAFRLLFRYAWLPSRWR